jgi:hypothetical protein
MQTGVREGVKAGISPKLWPGAAANQRVHKAFCAAVLQIAKKSPDQRVGLTDGKQVAARKRFGFKT